MVVLHTPISKVLGNSHSVVARSCGALLAIATELLSHPHHSPKFPLQTPVLFQSHNSHSSNSSHLVGEDEGNWNLLLKKKVRLSVFPPPHTFALQLCAGPLPCCALFVSGREGWGMQRSSWELTHWPWLLGFSACYCCNLQFQIARSKALLKDSLQPSPYPYSFSFKLYVARCAMEISTTIEAAEGLCSDVKRNGVQKAGLEMGALGLQCSALPSKL